MTIDQLEPILHAVQRAAALCRRVQQEEAATTLTKGDKSPVTVADFGSQALICHGLAETFGGAVHVIGEEQSDSLRSDPDGPLARRIAAYVSEQMPSLAPRDVWDAIDIGGKRTYADDFWTLDPIDGTKGFLRNEQYAIALAHLTHGKVDAAILGCPNLIAPDGSTGCIIVATGEPGLFWTSTENTATWSPLLPLTTPERRFCESVESAHSDQSASVQIASKLAITAPPIRMDSQAKYATVARGEACVYLRLPTRPGYVEKIWDHAAGSRIVEAAGGTVTDMYGSPLDFTHGAGLEKNKGVIATHGIAHAQVIEAIGETIQPS